MSFCPQKLIIFIITFINCLSCYQATQSSKFSNFPELFNVFSQANPLAHHELIFAVKQLNIEVLDRLLDSVSDITSEKYGHYITRAEVASLTANYKATVAIIEFLKSSGVTTIKKTTYGEYITAKAPIYIWEKMLMTVFHKITDKKNKKFAIRSFHFTLPKELQPHVLTILNTIQTPVFKSSFVTGSEISKANITSAIYPIPSSKSEDKNNNNIHDINYAFVTGFTYPKLINEYYNIDSNQGNPLATQAVFETSGQTFSTVDMTIFEGMFNLPIAQPVIDMNDHITSTACVGIKDCAEANLDMQYMMAIAQNTSTMYVSFLYVTSGCLLQCDICYHHISSK